jgi:lipoprotein LprG
VRTMLSSPIRSGLAMILVALLAATGCKGGDSGSAEDSPEDRMAAAKSSFDAAEYIGFTMKTDDLPDVQGLLEADGTGTHAPAFKGEVKVDTDLTAVTAPLIAVDGNVYAKLPFAGWSTLDPDDYGAPDPAQLMDTDNGLSSLFTATEDLEVGDSERSGETVLTDIDGTIPADAVKELFPSSGDDDFKASYKLTDDDDLDSATITGPFYDGHDDVTYTIEFDLNADSVDIEAP